MIYALIMCSLCTHYTFILHIMQVSRIPKISNSIIPLFYSLIPIYLFRSSNIYTQHLPLTTSDFGSQGLGSWGRKRKTKMDPFWKIWTDIYVICLWDLCHISVMRKGKKIIEEEMIAGLSRIKKDSSLQAIILDVYDMWWYMVKISVNMTGNILVFVTL